MAHDVFVSFSGDEADIAMSIVSGLEKRDIKCWISSRDIPAGSDYAEQIMYGINNCRLMVLILSSNTIKSQHVIRELDRAVHKKIQIVPFRIEDVELSASMEYYVGPAHWLNALTPDLETHIEELAVHIHKIFEKRKNDKIQQAMTIAVQSFKANNYSEARKYFKIVEEIDAKNTEALYYLNEIDRLEKEIAEKIEKYIKLCKEAIESKNSIQARHYLNKIIEIEKDNEDVAALQEKIQKLEQDRNRLISQGIEAGKKALAAKNYSQAISYFQKVLELDKDNYDIRELLKESKKLERERQEKIVELINSGKDAFQNENYKLAIDHFKNVLELEKENREALSYLTKIDEMQKKRKLKIADTLTLAERLLKSNYRNKAKELYEEVLRLDPKNKKAIRALNELQLSTIPSTEKKKVPNLKMVAAGIGMIVIVVGISVWLISGQKPVPPQPGPVPPIKTQPDDIQKRLNMVIESIADKDLSRAKTYIEEIVNEAPDNIQAQDLNTEILKLTNEISQLSELGRDAQVNKNYIKAKQYYLDILDIDKGNKNAHLMLKSIEQYTDKKLITLLSSAEKNLKDKNLSTAERQYIRILDYNPKNKTAKNALEKIAGIKKQINYFNQQGKEALEQKQYIKAKKSYQKVLGLDKKNKEALEGLDEAQSAALVMVKPVAIMLKDQKLEFLADSSTRLNFGEIRENETVKQAIQIKSVLNRKVQFGLHGCNWTSKEKPLGMKPIELFDSNLLVLNPNQSDVLKISLTIPEGLELSEGLYTGELLFKDLKGEYDYSLSFDFTFVP